MKKETNKNMRVQIRRIFSYLLPHKMLAIATIFFALVFASFEVFTDQFIEFFTDTIKEGEKGLALLPLLITQYIAISVFKEFSEYTLDILLGRLSGKFVSDLRSQFWKKLTRLPFRFFVDNNKGELISKFTNDAEKSTNIVVDAIFLVYHISTTLVFLAIISTKHLKLTLCLVTSVPLILIVIKLFARRIIYTGKRIQEQLAVFVTTMKDFLGGIRIIKSFGTEGFELKKFKRDNDEYYRRFQDNIVTRASFELIEGIVMSLAITIVIVYGGYEVMYGRLSIGVFVFVFNGLGEIHENISDIMEILGRVQTNVYSAQRIFDVLDMEEEIYPSVNMNIKEKTKGSIEFNNVSFKYSPIDDLVLKDISFRVEAGKSVALVGKSGSGKSTVANLLLRLYKIQDGDITIDGNSISNLPIERYRREVAVVPQDTFLFFGTIFDNISYGMEEVDEKRVLNAASKAHVLEFAKRMPEGLNTFIGEEGSSLSGGQRQRVAIARALLRSPKILILDEATSSLDGNSSKLIHKALDETRKGVTSLIITHKLSVAMKADKILFMDEGRIKEQGTHEELMDMEGAYYALYKQQF